MCVCVWGFSCVFFSQWNELGWYEWRCTRPESRRRCEYQMVGLCVLFTCFFFSVCVKKKLLYFDLHFNGLIPFVWLDGSIVFDQATRARICTVCVCKSVLPTGQLVYWERNSMNSALRFIWCPLYGGTTRRIARHSRRRYLNLRCQFKGNRWDVSAKVTVIRSVNEQGKPWRKPKCA